MVLRFFIIIGFVLSLISALGSFSIYQSYQNEREQRLDAESKSMQAQDSATAIKADIEQQKSRISDLETQVNTLKQLEQDAKTQAAAKEEELNKLKADFEAKDSELRKALDEVEKFRKKEKAPAPIAIPGTGSASSGVVAATAAATKAVVAPETPPVIPAEAPPSDDSRILTVNRKFNFIVVNLGLRDGLRMGDKVEVVQQGKVKASAQIEKIYDKFSAATLLNEDKGNPVREGDSIRKG